MLVLVYLLLAARRLCLLFLSVHLLAVAGAVTLAWIEPGMSQAALDALGMCVAAAFIGVLVAILLHLSSDAPLMHMPLARSVRDKMPTPYLLFLIFAVFVCFPAYAFGLIEMKNFFPIFGDRGYWPSLVAKGFGLSAVVADLYFWALLKWRRRQAAPY
jgi:hypothetical protein